MGSSSKKGGDTQDVPEIDPAQLIAQATAANRPNVQTPYGTQTWSGNTVTNQLSPELQAILAQQMGRASGPANQFTLQPQTADVLNGLNTRLNQRYGIALPPPSNGGAPGPGGGTGPGNGSQPPVTAPVTPPMAAPPTPARSGGFSGREFDSGAECVAEDSWLPYDTHAYQVDPGDIFPVHLPEVGFHSWRVEQVGKRAKVKCVDLTTKGGAGLRCSTTTPFNLVTATKDLAEGQMKLAPEMLGEKVFVLTPAGPIEDEIASVTDAGEQWVIPLSFGGRSFPAGNDPLALIFSHNVMKGLSSFTPSEGGGFDPNFMMSSGGNTLGGVGGLSGVTDQSWNAAIDYGRGPASTYDYGSFGEGLPDYMASLGGETSDPLAGGGGSVVGGSAAPGGAFGNAGYGNGFGLPPAQGAFGNAGYSNSPSATAPASSAPAANNKYGGFLGFLARVLPGEQVPGGGWGQWARGGVQLGTGYPVATGWDLGKKVVNKFDKD